MKPLGVFAKRQPHIAKNQYDRLYSMIKLLQDTPVARRFVNLSREPVTYGDHHFLTDSNGFNSTF